MPVRLLSLDGLVSQETFEVIEPADRRNHVMLESSDGTRVKAHKERILPGDALGKAPAIFHSGKYVGFCPKCATQLEVIKNHVTCPTHGQFPIVTHETKPKLTTKKQPKRAPAQRKQKMSKENSQPPVVDLDDIVKFGTELWTKLQLKFDHAKIDVQAHVLVAENPLRKLCFNTYDGTLGKKKMKDPNDELQLNSFRDNIEAVEGKHKEKLVGYQVNGEIDDIRKQLIKAGYKKR